MSAVTFSRVEAQALAARHAAPKQRLPLRRNYFGRVQPSQDDVRQYLSTATSLLDTALARARADRASGHAAYRTWKQLGGAAAPGRVQRLTQTDANGRDVHYRLQGTVVGASVHDLTDVLTADSSTAQVVARRRLLSNNSLDAQTLCVLRDRRSASTATYDHLSLRWEAIRLSPNSPIYDRDRCYLEFTGVTTDVDGTFVGFLIQHAVAVPSCRSLAASHGLARLDVTEVVLLRPSSVVDDSSSSSLQGTRCTTICLDGLVRRPSKFPPWLVHSYLSTLATCLEQLPTVVQQRLVATLPVRRPSQCVPRASRRHCHVCHSAFGRWSKKLNCHSCGDVACKSCVVARTGGETATFCTKCLTRAAAVRPSDCDSASFTTSSSASDCSTSHHRASENEPLTSTVTATATAITTATATPSLTSTQGKESALATPRRVRINTALLEDSRRVCSTASTASESSSWDSSRSDCCRREDLRQVSSLLDDDVDETLDTTQMLRGGRSGQSSRQVPTGRAIEDLIAHQRYLLQQMLSQARAYHHQWARA